MNLPQIDFGFWSENWAKSTGKLPVYSNENLRKFFTFSGDINACTSELKRITSAELTTENILTVVDLIYSWGGRSGRMFYAKGKKCVPRKKIEEEEVLAIYKTGIDLAKSGSVESIKFFQKVEGIGPSYASKHAYFWSLNSEFPLIIIDSKIAGALGYNTIPHLFRNTSYSEIISEFTKKSEEVFSEKDPSKIERALFSFHNNYFLNNNEGWKKSIQILKDKGEAERIAKALKIT